MDIINSHDKYFKKIFSRKEDAIDLLKGGLSPELVDRMDFSTMKRMKNFWKLRYYIYFPM